MPKKAATTRKKKAQTKRHRLVHQLFVIKEQIRALPDVSEDTKKKACSRIHEVTNLI
jgi:hypothetical protein